MAGKSFFIDTTRCMACRGCQIACKNWNQNKASETQNWGSYQNPKDLDGNTFKLVRFSEMEEDGKIHWYFFPDQCRHCLEPPCKDTIEGYVDGAVIQDKDTGAVLYTEKTKKVPYEEVRDSCPYNIPRKAASGQLVKCTMCVDRVSAGLLPACVKTCPTGAMNFGDRDKMLALAKKRLAELKKKYPKAQLLDPDSVRTIYLVIDDPQKYHKFAIASNDRKGISRKLAMKKMLGPARQLLKPGLLG
ncbi:MAG TPA: formate dehydrogenase [Deltaproteobacteria bacterium]|nr:MAG: formate dehydrogenase [Deltaproteobacteria bacterium]RLB08753.1 MAG: formate dehydrogenase [Deltaproteobacteria bacterium]HDM76400.1 formate dehydrogenase [Deltaproteobacteria bacterium]